MASDQASLHGQPRRIYIEEMASLLDRAVQTVRQWVQEDCLPAKLRPKREGGRQKIYWTPSQVDGMRSFATAKAARWRGNRSRS
jgi:hypothetical protein